MKLLSDLSCFSESAGHRGGAGPGAESVCSGQDVVGSWLAEKAGQRGSLAGVCWGDTPPALSTLSRAVPCVGLQALEQ